MWWNIPEEQGTFPHLYLLDYEGFCCSRKRFTLTNSLDRVQPTTVNWNTYWIILTVFSPFTAPNRISLFYWALISKSRFRSLYSSSNVCVHRHLAGIEKTTVSIFLREKEENSFVYRLISNICSAYYSSCQSDLTWCFGFRMMESLVSGSMHS